MTDKHHIERKKAFQPIYIFLLSNGITEYMTKTEIILNISNKYKSDFAQKVLELWFGVDPYNKDNLYYKQDLAYNISCEEITERIEAKDDIFRSNHDTPFLYKEKIDTKKVLLKIVRGSKKFLVLKTFIYMFIIFLIGHMFYSYDQVPNKDKDMMFIIILAMGALSIFLLTQVNNIIENWAIVNGSGGQMFFSYLSLIIGISILVYSSVKIVDPTLYFTVIASVIIVTTLILALIGSTLLDNFFYQLGYHTGRMLGKIMFAFLKYILPFIILIFLIKQCSSSDKKDTSEYGKKTVERVYEQGKKTVSPVEEKTIVEEKETLVDPNKLVDEILKKKIESCSYYYTTATVNLRSSSSKNSTILGNIKKSQKVCVTSSYDSWKYIENKGWVYDKFLMTESDLKKKNKAKEQKVKKRVVKSVWHCEAKSTRASGWVESIGKQNAIKGALHQCEIRRQTSVPCKIVNCYRL